MKLDIISDIHIEMNGRKSIDWVNNKTSDILLIAGDCANDPNLSKTVIAEAALVYDRVIFTDGNHDHYNGFRQHRYVGQNEEVFQQFADGTANISYLNKSSVCIDDTLFIGGNGWYDWSAYSMASRQQQQSTWNTSMADSSMIRFDDAPDIMAQQHAEALREMIELAQDDTSINNIVVMTHTIPTMKGLVADTHEWGPLNGSFANMFMGQVGIADKKKKIRLWNFGHTHFTYDFMEGGIRFVCNPRGYAFEGGRRPTAPISITV